MSLEEHIREIVRAAIRDELAPILESIEGKGEPASDRLVTINDVCERLDISRTTVYQMRKRGALKAVQIGGAVRFREEDVNALIEN